MTNVYNKTVRNILYLCKFVGIINMSYILESSGLIIKSTGTIYKCLEFTRTILLIAFTYTSYTNYLFLEQIYLFKLWSVIIASRISETRLIQLMNGIIEYDQKLKSLPRFIMIHQHSPKKNYWDSIFIFTIIYYITISFTNIILWPPNTINIVVITMYFFRLEYILDVTVFFFTYFFLQQLEYRFQTLNDFWKYLLPGFLSVPVEWTHSLTAMTLDKLRLLHAELSDLLRIFSMGFGQILLGFFVFSYMDMLLQFYYFINFDAKNPEKFIFPNFLRTVLPYIYYLNIVIWVLGIIIAASRVHEKKQKMISHLRLLRISKLSSNLKIQVKLFMNQITIFESSELTAFGIFSINLNLVISILILLITGIVTLIQMKSHPAILKSKQIVEKYMVDLNNLTFN